MILLRTSHTHYRKIITFHVAETKRHNTQGSFTLGDYESDFYHPQTKFGAR